MIFNILAWCLFGLIAGTLAQWIMPGKDPGQSNSVTGWLLTIVTGIVGAFVGGYVGSLLFNWDITGFNLTSLILAIAGALLLLGAYRAVMSMTHRTARV